MIVDELFNLLDLDGDGQLSRSELHDAARRLGWHWHEAPLYAVLDLLTVPAPLPRSTFVSYMAQMTQDPRGPYGQVLQAAPRPEPIASLNVHRSEHHDIAAEDIGERIAREPGSTASEASADILTLLKGCAGSEVSAAYRSLLQRLADGQSNLSFDATALLIIDPQRSFTGGTWMRSIGANADAEVEPIRLAFATCARILREHAHHIEVMFTRCPFPPGSYEWDDRVRDLIDESQLYFVKPGNSVLWPPTNGFGEWVEGLIDRGKKTLVMGGCTLNSCIRISSIETQQRFQERGLQVVVDLNLCGARTSNFVKAPLFGGLSSVESAVKEMVAAGVCVVQRVGWTATVARPST